MQRQVVLEPSDADVLARPPRLPAAEPLDRRRLAEIAFTGSLTAAVAFGVVGSS